MDSGSGPSSVSGSGAGSGRAQSAVETARRACVPPWRRQQRGASLHLEVVGDVARLARDLPLPTMGEDEQRGSGGRAGREDGQIARRRHRWWQKVGARQARWAETADLKASGECRPRQRRDLSPRTSSASAVVAKSPAPATRRTRGWPRLRSLRTARARTTRACRSTARTSSSTCATPRST